jgi:hypothetical protein
VKYNKKKKYTMIKCIDGGVKNIVIEDYVLPDNYYPLVILNSLNESFRLYKYKK